MGQARVSRFSDGETFCEIQENVRGVDTYIIQPTSSPVNENFMELLIMADALRRAVADGQAFRNVWQGKPERGQPLPFGVALRVE